MTIEFIEVSRIIADPRAQPRAQMDMFVVDDYKEKMMDGVTFPPVIVFCEDSKFWLADGFHRVNAARDGGIKTINADIKPGGLRDAILYSVGANADHGLRRTNLDKERAVKTLLNDPEWRKKSDSQIAQICRVTQPFVWKLRSSLITIISEDRERREYVTKHGTKSIMRIGNIGKSASEKIPEAIREQLKMTSLADPQENGQLKLLANIPEEKQAAVVEKITSGEAKNVLQARHLVNQEEVKDIEFPSGKYGVIYADPPWKYSQNSENYGPAERHYVTQETDWIKARPVNDLALDNSVLFLWVTSPKIEEGLEVARAWGFTYKSMFIWDKVKHNYGHYNSVRHEILLICTKGSCTPEHVELFDSVQTIERDDEHSEKPEYFREIINTLYPSAKKIELFGRKEAEGWHIWGNLPS